MTTSKQRALAERLERLQLAVRSELATVISQLPGGVATFDAPDSFVNRIGAVALDGPVSRSGLEALAEFLVGRGAPALFETSPASHPSAEEHLPEMGFRVDFTVVVLVRELTAPASTALAPHELQGWPRGCAWSGSNPRTCRACEPTCRSPVPASGSLARRRRRTSSTWASRAALRPHCDSWVAIAGEQVVGGGGCETREGVTALFGTAVLPEWRGRGIQQALFQARLERARALGSTLVSVGSAADSPTLRNALRFGFTEAYRRKCWTRAEHGQRS